ncbi:uncharacterized protein LOC111088330 [Limulus polyphemus]|uniref:Uncharacterized protein LOC111088330 n=1 Tax=Limulus polyphemus TaxID=6850 RepID=A0ABM1TD82_LIMPO|nr:uncharacterized protein LOC111088330 [Limulus polyphemus]XP_022253839.1 uncharacterized protein LOC111088330 [Limulus polyphemus]
MKVHSPRTTQSPRSHPVYQVPKEKLSRAVILKIWLGLFIFLFVTGGILVVLGVIFWQTGLGMFLGGVFSLILAVPTLALYLWYIRWRKVETNNKSRKDHNTISTIGNPDFYTPAPLQLKSDYPMGPLLIMTLPRNKPTSLSQSLDDSIVESTPDISGEKSPINPRKKNLPPLASTETLSPSVVSLNTAV